VTFKNAPDNPASAMMTSIQNNRGSGPDSPIVKLASNSDFTAYAMTLIPYAAPWAVLFILSIIGW
jgi:hypothetical protein